MALTVANVTSHAQAYVKTTSNVLSAEELRIAQTVNNWVNTYFPWRWAMSNGTDISLSSGTQEYNLAAGDQNRVHKITEAWLTSGSTLQPPLSTFDDPPIPSTGTTGQPFAVSLISETRVRFYPTPGATYTFSFRYHNAGTVFTVNTDTYDAPTRFDEAIKTGVIWQTLEFMHDDQAPRWKEMFDKRLEEQRLIEIRRMHLTRY